uniref:Bromo domain-containing protein n=1 Tax=Ascaris lumbricoides TaxID=6252 RepID=A0A0M3HFH2_ASCLU
MELLREYAASSDGAESDPEDEKMRAPITLESCKSLALSKTTLDMAPAVTTKHDIGGLACVDPRTKELDYNPKYEELFQPIVSSRLFAFKNLLMK